MKHSLQTVTLEEEKRKTQLRTSIQRKSKVLETVTEKVELLKMELELVKNEYNSRIGRLFLKDNNLDLEIIKYKNIKHLMEEGMTFGEAVKELEDRFYEELLRLQGIQEEIDKAEQVFKEYTDIKQEDTQDKDIRKLWKSLIVKFHPDLVTDPIEKNRREELMKKINTAYREGDFEALKILESKTFTTGKNESDIMSLEKTLVNLENMIIHLRQEFKNLKLSDWYGWELRIEKAKKEHKDIFAELERSLLDDIVKKIEILNRLKVQVNNTSNQPI